MPLPTADDLKRMNYSYNAQPFVSVPSKSDINLNKLDYSYFATPFCSNGFVTVITTFIKKINGVLRASTKTINTVLVSSIKSWNGVS